MQWFEVVLVQTGHQPWKPAPISDLVRILSCSFSSCKQVSWTSIFDLFCAYPKDRFCLMHKRMFVRILLGSSRPFFVLTFSYCRLRLARFPLSFHFIINYSFDVAFNLFAVILLIIRSLFSLCFLLLLHSSSYRLSQSVRILSLTNRRTEKKRKGRSALIHFFFRLLIFIFRIGSWNIPSDRPWRNSIWATTSIFFCTCTSTSGPSTRQTVSRDRCLSFVQTNMVVIMSKQFAFAFNGLLFLYSFVRPAHLHLFCRFCVNFPISLNLKGLCFWCRVCPTRRNCQHFPLDSNRISI